MSLAPPKPSPLVPGYRLDRYELLCPVAQGGMASVWVARMRGKHGFEKLVAIKTILPQYAADPRFQTMFLDEARIASRIEHDNVAQILDLGDEHGVLYLVMEWIDGDALSKLHRAIEKKRQLLPLGIALRVVADACGGLHAAHELLDVDGSPLGVVHRDVSPQNILVSARGVAKVIDFGIAKARDRIAGETGTGFLKGKVQYMAPEQALGKSVDRRADVWAAGAILYHLFTGSPPFDADNQLATLHLLTSGKPPMPLPSSVPAPVAMVVAKALAHDPAARYATARDLQRAIEAAMVETSLVTTAADVAAFTAQHVGDRAEARKKAIELALQAASERARMEQLLVPPSTKSSSGFGDVRAPAKSASGVAPLPDLRPPTPGFVAMEDARPSAKVTVAEVPNPYASAARQKELDALARMPISDASSHTLGSAALETEIPLDGARRRTVAAAAFGVALLVSVAVLAWRGGAASAPRASVESGSSDHAAAITPAAYAPRAEASVARAPEAPRPPTPTIPPPPEPTASAAPSAVASAAPLAATPKSVAPAAVRAPIVRAPAPAAARPAGRPARRAVDDGF